jgi:hypothetical protein
VSQGRPGREAESAHRAEIGPEQRGARAQPAVRRPKEAVRFSR